jgi:hypothetical protein
MTVSSAAHRAFVRGGNPDFFRPRNFIAHATDEAASERPGPQETKPDDQRASPPARPVRVGDYANREMRSPRSPDQAPPKKEK